MRKIDGKHLATFRLSAADFDFFLEKWKGGIEKAEGIERWFHGRKYSPKPSAKKYLGTYGTYKGTECVVCPEYWLDPKGCKNSWRQVILKKDESLKKSTIEKDANGQDCYKRIMEIVEAEYSTEEIEACFKSHEADYDPSLKQIHYVYAARIPKIAIYALEDCVKYDVNGAHCDALCEIFPRCRERFERLYRKRKKKPIVKKWFNYAVGMLNTPKINRQRTYNWIVQRTSKKLLAEIKKVGGELIYANTDGFVARKPKYKPKGTEELGGFKKEYEGTVYFYRDKNYVLYQAGTDQFGSCLTDLRDSVDLSKGKVIHYDLKESEPMELKDGRRERGLLRPENITKEEVRILWQQKE